MRGLTLAAVLFMPALLSGCVTHSVWEAGAFSRYYEPADPPNLTLFYSPSENDLLVQYSERREEQSKTQRRAFWLLQNEEQLKKRTRPKFVSASLDQGLTPVPVLQSSASSEASSGNKRYAILSTNEYAFTVYANGKEEGSYELPVYEDRAARTKQILLTPPALIADATIIAGVAALVSLPWWWPSLNDWVH